MKPRRKRIIRSLELDEISAVGKPAMEGALHKITRSAPVDITAPVPGPIVLTGEQRERANAWAAEYLKSMKQAQEVTKMNEPKTTADIVKAYMDRHDVTEMEAFAKVSTRPEYAAAYEAETRAGHVQRQIDKRKQVYGE